jgi:hypothetical protein
LDEVAVSGLNGWLAVDRRDRVKVEELFAPGHIDVQVDMADRALADLQPLVGTAASVVGGRVAGRARGR